MLRKSVNEIRSNKQARVDNDSCPLADKILHSYNLGDKALSDYVNSLDKEQVDTLVHHFECTAKLGRDILLLLKALLSFLHTRHTTLSTCIRLIQQNEIRGRAAFYCMSELHLGVIQYRTITNQFKGKSSALQNTLETTLAQLRELSDLVLQPLFTSLNIPKSSSFTSLKEENGFLMVLDLVPTIVSTMNTVGFELTTDSLSGDDIVSNLLEIPWKSRGIVPLSLSLLTELDLNSEQCEILCNKLIQFQELEIVLEEGDFATVLKQELSFAEKYPKYAFIEGVKGLLSKAPEREMANIAFLIELSLQHSAMLGNIALSAFDCFIKNKGANIKETDVFYPSDMFLLLLLACIEMNKDKVLLAVASVFSALIAPATPRECIGVEGSGNALELLEILLSKFVKFPGLDIRSHLLTELGIYLFELRVTGFTKSTMNSIKILGECLIIKTFEQFPLARSEILASAFTVISEEPCLESKDRYCTLLEKIAEKQLFSLVDFTSKISDWLSYLIHFPLSISKRILSAFLPLCSLSPPFFDSMFIMLRKFMGAKGLESRILAIHGLTTILLHYAQNERIQLEILSSLRPAFSFPIEIREHLYFAVSLVLEKFREQEGKVTLNKQAMSVLCEMVLHRFERYFSRENGKFHFSLYKCFEDTGADFEPIPREHLGSLFHCVLELFSLRLNDELIEMLILMVQQLRKSEVFTEFCIFKESTTKGKVASFANVLEHYKGFVAMELPECDPTKITSLQRAGTMAPIYFCLADHFLQRTEIAQLVEIGRKPFEQGIDFFEYFSLLFLYIKSQNSSEPFHIWLNESSLKSLMTMIEVFCNEDEKVYSPSMGAVVSITELIMLNLEAPKNKVRAEGLQHLSEKMLIELLEMQFKLYLFVKNKKKPSGQISQIAKSAGVSALVESNVKNQRILTSNVHSLIVKLLSQLSIVSDNVKSALNEIFEQNEYLQEIYIEKKSKFKPSHLALYFAKRLYELVEDSSPVYVLQSNQRLIEVLLSLDSDKQIRKKIMKTMKGILCDFSVKQATVLKSLFRFVLNYSSNNGFDVAAESLKYCLQEEEEDKNEEEKTMNLKANSSCLSVSIVTILLHLESFLNNAKKTDEDDITDFEPLIDMITSLLQSKKHKIAVMVNAKLLAVIEKLFRFLSKFLHIKRQQMKSNKDELAEPFRNKKHLEILVNVKKLSKLLSVYLEKGKKSFSKVTAKKIPAIVFVIDKFNIELENLLVANKGIKGIEKVKAKLKVNEEEDEEEEEMAVVEEEEGTRTKRRQKRTLRSRNKFIDTMLVEETGEDDYSDLEDWIVNEDDEDLAAKYQMYVNPFAE